MKRLQNQGSNPEGQHSDGEEVPARGLLTCRLFLHSRPGPALAVSQNRQQSIEFIGIAEDFLLRA